jgi:nucleosome assembly protein 1-like 1
MKNIVVKRLQIEKEFKDLHNKLEAKYEATYKPIYEKRAKIIDGTEVINTQDIQEGMTKLSIKDSSEPEDNKEVGIPEYWGKAIANTDQFAQITNDKDKKILKSLSNVTADIKENGDFTLNFTFAPNDYFEHHTLTREHILNQKDNSIEKIVSTEITWKSEEMNPTVEKKTKKIKNKKTKDVKTVTKTEEVPSFFSFFKSYDVSGKTKDKEEEDEDEEDEFEIISEEYEVALFVKEELIPYSIEYYLDMNKNDMDEFDEDEEDEEDDE